MLKEALQYLTDLGRNELLEVGGIDYSTKKLYQIAYPKPAEIQTRTLTALVDYIKSGLDQKFSEKLLIHIISPDKVALYSELRIDEERETYMECCALLPSIHYGRFIDVEQFNIMLQANFVDEHDRGRLLLVTGRITDGAVKEVGDDGVSQAVTIKTGVAKVDNVVVPNPAVLAPYRTFPEIEQPSSAFIFRMQSGPSAAIFEADGGAWRNVAMRSIKNYLEENLEGLENISVIY